MARVFSGVGHGGNDKGAVANGLRESDVNLVMAQACNEVLVAHGVDNPMSRYKDENDDLNEEIREANASGASIAIDFHNNAGGGDGFEAFYSIGDTNGKRLAKCIEKHVKSLGQNSRGVKTKVGAGGKDYFGFIRQTNMTAIIVESFFLDSDDKFIADTVGEQKQFGVAIAKGILEYLGISYKGNSNTSISSSSSPGYWHHNGKGWSFYFHKGGYAKNQWLQLDAWYLFNKDGYAYQNEFYIDDQKRLFYFDNGCRSMNPGDVITLRAGNYCELSVQ